MGGNLPVVPLHELQDDLIREPAFLFKTAPKVRMRDYGRFGRWYGQPASNIISFGNVNTSIVSMITSDDADVPLLLDAGRNPRPGIVFHYALAERPDEPVILNFRTASGDLIRSFTSQLGESATGNVELPAEPGINRFHWNLRYPGATDVVETLSSWKRPDGPLVVPAQGIAELVVDDETYTRTFEVRIDPRIDATQANLEQQRDLLLEIRDCLSQNNELINNLVALKNQVEFWATRTSDPAILETGAAVTDEVDDLLPDLINVGISESQLYPSGLHEKLNALFESVDSADYAPPQQARDVLTQLSEQLDQHVERASTTLSEKMQAFNDAIQAAGLKAADSVG